MTLVALIAGGLLAYLQPNNWYGWVLLTAGFICGISLYRQWQFEKNASEEEKRLTRKRDKRNRELFGVWLLVAFVVILFLAIVAVGVGFILSRSGEDIGEIITNIAIYCAGGISFIMLAYFMFFAEQ